MRVRFLRDYRGANTFEHWYATGEVVELPNGEAQALLSEGVVEPVEALQESRSHVPLNAVARKGAKRGAK
jgi:hypothetical protein